MDVALPSTMKAARRIGSGPLEEILTVSTDVPLPKDANPLPADHVLVKMAYTSLNPMDFKVAETPLIGTLAFKGIPCLDFAGSVAKSTTSQFHEGDRVYGQTQPMNFGACAEYVVVAGKLCMPMPTNMRLEDSATIGIAALTAYQTIVPFVKTENSVLIVGGSGGVGTYTIQIAKAVGCSVTATCSGTNVDLCKRLGADEVIDYRAQNVIEALEQSGKQYDLIVDNIFVDAQLYRSCHEYLKPAGRYVTIAAAPTLTFLRDVSTILLWPTFLGGGSRRFQLVGRTVDAQDYGRIAAWISEGVIKPVIEHIYDIEDIRTAFRKLKTGRARGKLVVRIA